MSGAHALRHPWRKWVILAAALCLLGVLPFLGGSRAGAADVFPSQDACHVTSNASPAGDCGAFKLLDRETFNGYTVPLGSFTGCAGDGDFKCSGLKSKYAHTYGTLGAYPRGWYDTANPRNHSNGNSRTFGGEYRADDTTWIAPASSAANADGQLHVRMYRPAGSGDNHVSAPVPLKCMNLRYGKFTERTKISARTDGFKMAHLRYSPNEIDYPEAGGNFSSDPISEFTHGFSESGADAAGNSAWTSWHTYSLEIVPGHVRFYFDGKLFKTVNADFPDATDWVLQNESSLSGGYAAHGASVQIDTSWLTCYRYAP